MNSNLLLLDKSHERQFYEIPVSNALLYEKKNVPILPMYEFKMITITNGINGIDNKENL